MEFLTFPSEAHFCFNRESIILLMWADYKSSSDSNRTEQSLGEERRAQSTVHVFPQSPSMQLAESQRKIWLSLCSGSGLGGSWEAKPRSCFKVWSKGEPRGHMLSTVPCCPRCPERILQALVGKERGEMPQDGLWCQMNEGSWLLDLRAKMPCGNDYEAIIVSSEDGTSLRLTVSGI